jgi:hypothetical protein
MRRGVDGLALLAREVLKRDPHCGHQFVLRGERGGLIKVLWHDGQGMCLLAKRLGRGRELIDRSLGINPNNARAWSVRGRITAWTNETNRVGENPEIKPPRSRVVWPRRTLHGIRPMLGRASRSRSGFEGPSKTARLASSSP